ncbi:MAG: hypothetical protein PHF35_03395 [Candidatus Moranbacteria bacterium]|nr:hypothetical protein [Candidatus Moranbacteria bacterium]
MASKEGMAFLAVLFLVLFVIVAFSALGIAVTVKAFLFAWNNMAITLGVIILACLGIWHFSKKY